MVSREKFVKAYLRAHAQGKSLADLARAVGLDPRVAYKRKAYLIDSGMDLPILQSGRGKESGIKAAKTNKKKYGKNFYAQIGKIGGGRSRNGGFGSLNIGADGLTGKQRAQKVGHIGGKISKRGKNAQTTTRSQ